MAKRSGKSLKLNMVLNGIKGLMGIIFPLISFPYVSRVLGVENVGKYNFANSVINYFILIAGLGISTYAIREGAKVRNQDREFKEFSDEIFTVNMLSTIMSYALLFICVVAVRRLHAYKALLIILSLQIIFRTISVDWIYSIYEDYLYITVRSIVFQIVSLALLFLLVHTQKDLLVYAGIVSLANGGSNILSYIHSRKYCKLGFTGSIDWKRHMKPIMVLFAMNLMTTLYVSSGTTILGFMSGDYAVGIYAVSSKIYSVVKTILSSVLIVSIPRLASLIGENRMQEFNESASDICSTLLTISIPSIVGIILLRNEIVLLISDATYASAASSLFWLSIALLFCMGAWFWGQCILVPMNMEGTVFKATVVSAIVNIAISFTFIPRWQENAVAIGTVVAEGISFAWCVWAGREKTTLTGIGRNVAKILAGCLLMSAYILLIRKLHLNDTVYLAAAVFGSIAIYFAIEILLKNDTLRSPILRRRSFGKKVNAYLKRRRH